MSPEIGSGGFSRNSGDAPGGIRHHEPEGSRVLHVMQCDRRGGALLAMSLEHRRQIQVGQDVAVQGEERLLAEMIERVHDRSARPERVALRDPGDRGIATPRLEERVERVFEVRRRHDHLEDAVGDEMVQDVAEDGPIDEREQRLGHGLRERAEPRPLAAHEDDGLHDGRPQPRGGTTRAGVDRAPLMRGASAPPGRSRR